MAKYRVNKKLTVEQLQQQIEKIKNTEPKKKLTDAFLDKQSSQIRALKQRIAELNKMTAIEHMIVARHLPKQLEHLVQAIIASGNKLDNSLVVIQPDSQGQYTLTTVDIDVLLSNTADSARIITVLKELYHNAVTTRSPFLVDVVTPSRLEQVKAAFHTHNLSKMAKSLKPLRTPVISMASIEHISQQMVESLLHQIQPTQLMSSSVHEHAEDIIVTALTELVDATGAIAELARQPNVISYAPHRDAMRELAQRVDRHTREFLLQTPSTQNFMRFKTQCEHAIVEAETSFSKDTTIWRNYIMPVINLVLRALNEIKRLCGVPAERNFTLFKPQTQVTQAHWDAIKPRVLAVLNDETVERATRNFPS
jgi:hypothetical protein